jgi:hypothetical protein
MNKKVFDKSVLLSQTERIKIVLRTNLATGPAGAMGRDPSIKRIE